ncbi:T9SS type A sorting domain-containing protein [Parachryseolinea silvisoli]|uniref:T9SS type A sorting domain-containing protein n=1 Tax=Parachryseolinea silvisoli TaxID=2873601 RepID=UPI00226599EF|nr:T9SS type A sorting domain-containing protein [Parachryseolinea silvisoli]MCD9015349.1 T9SS type A sorting domain-containing protein [Parachryseolinea silvisoli]
MHVNFMKYVGLVLLLTCVCLESQAQVSIARVWDQTLGGTADDRLFCQVATPDGGYLLAGESRSNPPGDKSEFGRGAEDYWLVKTDGSGTKLWDKTYGGGNMDILRALVAAPDGGYLLCGYSTSGAGWDKTHANLGGRDFWVVKVDANGNKLWDKTLGSSGSDILYAATITADGGFLLVGETDAGSVRSTDYLAIKLNALGTTVWSRTYGGNGIDIPSAVHLTSTGGFLISGYSDSNISGEKSQNRKGSFDYWVVRIMSTGTKMWDRTIGGSGLEFLRAACITPADELIIGGMSMSPVSSDRTTAIGGSDFWIVKLNTSGTKVWDKSFGGTGSDECRSISNTQDGGFLLAGTSSSGASGNKTEPNLGGNDYWAVKTDANGNLEWDKTLGGTSDDNAQVGIQTTDNAFLLGGWSASTISATKSVNSKGLADFWIIQIQEDTCSALVLGPDSLSTAQVLATYSQALAATGGHTPYAYSLLTGTLPPGISWDAVTGILTGVPDSAASYPLVFIVTDSLACTDTTAYILEVQPDTDSLGRTGNRSRINATHAIPNLSLYPNPVDESFTIQWRSSASKQKNIIRIYNDHGRKVFEHSALDSSGENQPTRYPVSHLPPGIYTVVIQNEGKQQTLRMIKR